MGPLVIESIVVDDSRVEAVVRVTAPTALRTSSSPGLAGRALELLPGLARHSCENGAGHDALRELRDTETPHLLEHVAAELMSLSGSPRTLRGETAWDFARDGAGVFRVRLAYDIDVVAIGALTEALTLVEWLLVPKDPSPDVDAAVARLAAVRRGTD